MSRKRDWPKDTKLTRDQVRQMKSYLEIKPVITYKGSNNLYRMSMTITINNKLGGDANIDILEGIVLEVYMMCLNRDINYIPSMFIREVKTRYIRWFRKESGLTAIGTKPVHGDWVSMVSVYNEEGDNLIDSISDDYEFPEWYHKSKQRNADYYKHEEEHYEEN